MTHHEHIVPRRLQIQNLEGDYFPRLATSSKISFDTMSDGHMFEMMQKIEMRDCIHISSKDDNCAASGFQLKRGRDP